MVIEVCVADLVTFDADAIVCPAHFSLRAGSGLCGAIHKEAGRELEAECQEIRARLWGAQSFAPTGAGIITRGYGLRARWVIHVVVPRMALLSGDEDSSPRLADCVDTMVKLANDASLSSVALPCLGTGVYKWPRDRVARIMVWAIEESCRVADWLSELYIVCPDEGLFALVASECDRVGFEPMAIEGETDFVPRRRYALRQDS